MSDELVWPKSVTKSLCKLAEEHTCLWDPREADYPKHKLRAKLFTQIALEIKSQYPIMSSLTGDQARAKFKKLKSYFIREHKKLQSTPSGSIGKISSKWEFYDCLAFLSTSGEEFSDEQDEILVKEVAKYPLLWQLSHPKYEDQQVKDNIWADVAIKVVRPVHDCKKRWQSIKDTYDRKKIEKTILATPPMKKGKTWALEEKLSFLQPAEEDRGFSNITAIKEEEFDYDPDQVIEPLLIDDTSSRPNSEQSTPTPSASPIPLPPQTSSQQSSIHTQGTRSYISRRTNHREKRIAHLEMKIAERNEMIKNLLSSEQNLDEIDLFFQSIAKSVKKLPPHLQHRAKVKTLATIGNLEVEMLNSYHPAPFQYHSPSASGSLSASE
ncbi:uncharacterized protein LOC143017773 [Oratosquilla oratoria]|uniref:uncharacterized protein LOC143017773 n=1 Tax=Oratosquilla oratoria TaxID=337810 RepID=UPI003F767952